MTVDALELDDKFAPFLVVLVGRNELGELAAFRTLFRLCIRVGHFEPLAV